MKCFYDKVLWIGKYVWNFSTTLREKELQDKPFKSAIMLGTAHVCAPGNLVRSKNMLLPPRVALGFFMIIIVNYESEMSNTNVLMVHLLPYSKHNKDTLRVVVGRKENWRTCRTWFVVLSTKTKASAMEGRASSLLTHLRGAVKVRYVNDSFLPTPKVTSRREKVVKNRRGTTD